MSELDAIIRKHAKDDQQISIIAECLKKHCELHHVNARVNVFRTYVVFLASTRSTDGINPGKAVEQYLKDKEALIAGVLKELKNKVSDINVGDLT
jgi:hypothetical protein